MTVAAALAHAARAVGAVSDTPRLDAGRMLQRALRRDAAWIVANPDAAVGKAALLRLNDMVARRRAGEPLPYLEGEAWFYGRPFEVGPDVLVPRPETEHVVEAALDDLRARRRSARLRACDVGTGSGAIALTLAAEVPALEVVASDSSAAALAVARRNATRLGLAQRVTFVAGDLAEPVVGLGPFDCIVANLPYVPTARIPRKPDPVAFEPRAALDGGTDGLALYRRFVAQLPAVVAPGGAAFLEAAPGTVERLARIAARALPDAHIEVGEDYAGLERWVAISL